MHFAALATDYDGTIAHDGVLECRRTDGEHLPFERDDWQLSGQAGDVWRPSAGGDDQALRFVDGAALGSDSGARSQIDRDDWVIG